MNDQKTIRLEVADGYYLSRIIRSDQAAYLEHSADPEIAANLLTIPFPYTEAEADWWLDRCEDSSNSQPAMFAIREPSEYLIGSICIFGALDQGAYQAEFGYRLAKSHRGRGLMPRVIHAFSTHAFEQLHLHRLHATPFVSNQSSHRALERAGFLHEGTLRHQHLKDGNYLDAVVYGRIFESGGNA